MPLIPTDTMTLPDIGAAVELESITPEPSKTWRIDWHNNRIVGMIDGKEAVEQAIRVIIQTVRFWFVIYSWNFGFESDALIGKSEAVLRSEVRRLLTEALTQDERILSVENVNVNWVKGRSAGISFTANTTEGDIEINNVEVSL